MKATRVTIVFLITTALFLVLLSSLTMAENNICAVYFTGIGCPHCAITDPIVLDQKPSENPNFVVIEYEIYDQGKVNSPVFYDYNSKYHGGLGVPYIIFKKDDIVVGDTPILSALKRILTIKNNKCPLLGEAKYFNELDITSLPGEPKIWKNDRILIATTNKNGPSKLLRELLDTENVSETLDKSNIKYRVIEAKPAIISGKVVEFENAIRIDDWIFEWNGASLIEHANVRIEKSIEVEKEESLEEKKGKNNLYLYIILTIIAISIIMFIILFKKSKE